VLYEPPRSVWETSGWGDELAPHYETVRRMLGATETPFEGPGDALLRRLAAEMGAGDSYRPTTVVGDFDRCVLGGCCIGPVVDRFHRVLSEPGLHVRRERCEREPGGQPVAGDRGSGRARLAHWPPRGGEETKPRSGA
jgi:hypothetical protein